MSIPITSLPTGQETLKNFMEGPQVHELQRMNPSHHRIVDLALEGLTRNEIALQMDRSPEGVGIILNSPLVQGELARRRGLQEGIQTKARVSHLTKAREILEEAAVPAAQTLVALLDCPDANTRRLSAKDIFSQVYGNEGVKAPSITTINVEQMNLLIQTLQEDKLITKG